MTPLVFGLPGGAEWILIILAMLLIFGGSRIAGIGKGTGRAVREFKEEIRGSEAPQVTAQPTAASPTITTPVVTAPVVTASGTTAVPAATVETDPVDAPRAQQSDLR